VSGQLADLVVGLSRFGDNEGLVSGLVDGQLRLWSGALGDWVVLPIGPTTRFSVLAHDVEGERQAREIIQAFVGPGVATLNNPEAPASESEERRLAASGVHRILGLDVRRGQNEALLYALESLTATRSSIDRVTEERPTDPVSLLRDFRLALAQGDGRVAEDRLDALRGTGNESQENLRFLRVELLARFKRWPELVSLPYFTELEKVRRPRRVSELMLVALWHIDVLGSGRPPAEAFRASDLPGRHRALLGSVDVPRQSEALALCYLSALADGDEARLDRLLSSSGADRKLLESLTWGPEPSPQSLEDPVQEARRLLDRHQFTAVVDLFLERRESELADLAVESVLELNDPPVASEVLAVVRSLLDESFRPSRRLSRDLAELEAKVSGVCSSWTEWIERVAGDVRWGEASAIARQNAADWPTLPLSEILVGEAADLLVNSADGINGDQVARSLDLLCAVASRSADELSQSAFIDAVLLILSMQENIGGPVRNAFNDLAWALLEAGPSRPGYEGLISAATVLWERIAAPQSVDWALELLDALAGHPLTSPDSAARFALEIRTRCMPFVARFSPRQALAMRSLLEEFELPGWPDLPSPDSEERDVWPTLDGASVGLYSLMAGAGAKLRAALDQLCQVRSLTQRTDTHASAGLQTLARNADYMVVDTWHAAHPATACIDNVRPRSEQILPRRGGTPALVAAIEDALIAQTSGAGVSDS
jgi:hypothetical protein